MPIGSFGKPHQFSAPGCWPGFPDMDRQPSACPPDFSLSRLPHHPSYPVSLILKELGNVGMHVFLILPTEKHDARSLALLALLASLDPNKFSWESTGER
jgi:hypothetical protein